MENLIDAMIRELFVFLLILAGVFLSSYKKKLKKDAALMGGLVASLLYLGADIFGVVMLASFFIAGNLATHFHIDKKIQLGLAESNEGERTISQVLANAGWPAIVAIISIMYPDFFATAQVLIAASFASATSDTISSELGNLYGTRHFNIITFKTDQRGKNGVISQEGTLFGLAGSGVIALIAAAFLGWDGKILIIFLVGIFGNLMDSVLGATLENKNLIGNDLVNFLSIFSAVIFSLTAIILLNYW